MLRVTGLSALKPDGKLIRRILRVGIPAGIENGMFQIGKHVGGPASPAPRHRRHRGQCRGQHHQHLPEHPGHRRRHGGAHGGGPVPRCRRERAGGLVCPPPAAGGLLRCLGHEPVGLLLRRPLGAVLVQPLAGGFGHGAGSHDVVQHRLPLLLALQLHPAQHPPFRRRRQLHP